MTEDISMGHSRLELARYKSTTIKAARSWFAPDVFRLDDGAESWILKDFSRRPALFRATICRYLVSREVAAYRRLDGLAGIPRIIAHVDPYAFVMERMVAIPLPSREDKNTMGRPFFDLLFPLVEEMHKRGVAHGDLRRRNILMTPDSQPCLIDFATAIVDGSGWLRHRIFLFVARIDSFTILRIKGKYYPRWISGADRKAIRRPPWHLAVGRFFRRRVYTPLSPKRIKPLWKKWFGK